MYHAVVHIQKRGTYTDVSSNFREQIVTIKKQNYDKQDTKDLQFDYP